LASRLETVAPKKIASAIDAWLLFARDIIAAVRVPPRWLWSDAAPTSCAMPAKLHRKGVEFAKELVSESKIVRDERDAWSEYQPSPEQENEFTRARGFEVYAKWHLGIDDEHPANAKGRYEFPFGDFKRVLRCAVISAESRAGQYKHSDIEAVAAHLLEMSCGKKHKQELPERVAQT
jgi:hypothetical protein